MKIFLQKFTVVSLFLIFLLGFSACSKSDETKNVREYNNSIIAIQQKMLEEVSVNTGDLGNQSLDIDSALAQVDLMQRVVQQNFDEFQKIAVPKGAEELAASMKHFFQVETQNVQSLRNAYADLEGRANDQKLIAHLIKTLEEFGRNENEALANFDQVQQKVAAKYGETIQVQ